MAGALTANSITARTTDDIITITPTAIADIALLSPVDGANNVLLTAVFIIGDVDGAPIFTFQWYRCAPGATVGADTLGTAVGDVWLVDGDVGNGAYGAICIQAIDRGPDLTSAYALAASDDQEAEAIPGVLYVDAVLYD